jgi:hypothetical protein
MVANGHCRDFLSETRSTRYGAARFTAQQLTDQLIMQLIHVEHGEPFETVEPQIMSLLTKLLKETFEIVTARPVREILSRKDAIQ